MPWSHQKHPSATRLALLELFLNVLTFLIKLPVVELSGRRCSCRLIPLTLRLWQHRSTYGVNYFLSTAAAPQGGHFYCVHNDWSNTQNYKYWQIINSILFYSFALKKKWSNKILCKDQWAGSAFLLNPPKKYFSLYKHYDKGNPANLLGTDARFILIEDLPI